MQIIMERLGADGPCVIADWAKIVSGANGSQLRPMRTAWLGWVCYPV